MSVRLTLRCSRRAVVLSSVALAWPRSGGAAPAGDVQIQIDASFLNPVHDPSLPPPEILEFSGDVTVTGAIDGAGRVDGTIRRVPGVNKAGNIVLKRGIDENKVLWEWRKKVIDQEVGDPKNFESTGVGESILAPDPPTAGDLQGDWVIVGSPESDPGTRGGGGFTGRYDFGVSGNSLTLFMTGHLSVGPVA